MLDQAYINEYYWDMVNINEHFHLQCTLLHSKMDTFRALIDKGRKKFFALNAT